MNKITNLFILFLIFLFFYEIRADRGKIVAELQQEMISSKLADGWTVENVGLNKHYTYTVGISTPANQPWKTFYGTILNLNFFLTPVERLVIDTKFKFLGSYADRLWLPVNDEHRMYVNKENIKWTYADIKYSFINGYIQYFRSVGHYHWGYEGDMFNLYPEQFEVDRYLRVSGRPVPEGTEFYIKSRYGITKLVAGPEVIWGYKNGLYFKHNFPIKQFSNTIMYINHIIPYGEPEERLQALQINSKFKIYTNNFLHIGLLYQPFRLNKPFQYVEEVTSGEGVLGSKYKIKSGTTETKDAIATKLKFTSYPAPILNELNLELGYFGPVAGNKQELKLQTYKKVSPVLVGTIDCLYRTPLIGPLPLLYEGTTDNPGPVVAHPRGIESPFWVNWENREAYIGSLTLTFDPTPRTWVYKYQPNIFDEWNINPGEDAPVVVGIKYTVSHYPTSTDRLYYWDENGNVVWEPYWTTGAWATSEPLHKVDLMLRTRTRKFSSIFNLSVGEEVAQGSLAYKTAVNREKPFTQYLTAGITANYGPYSGKISYSQDFWGPEEWHKTFGSTIDRLYKLSFRRTFGEYFVIDINYVALRERDEQYLAPELGSYDEIKLTATLKLPVTISF